MEPKGRLLLADDEETYLEAMAMLLRVHGYEVDGAPSVPEARRLLEERRYDVLVTDLHMPGGPVLDLVRAMPSPNEGLPVILMTGRPTMDSALEAVGRAVLAYYVKPVDVDVLLASLATGVRLRKVQSLALESSTRLQAWAEEMRAIERDIRSAPASMGALPLSGLVGLVMGNLAASTLEIKQLLDLALASDPGKGVCAIRDCPRLGRYQEALREGVEVLERTKTAFKSKDLGDLRKRFQTALEGTPALPE